MSFLAPLYLAGALAVVLPILFHLLRRTPRDRQTFSSLMFLAPTPPRMTRKSRLDNLLLLILRALVLVLLALAFMRPFLAGSGSLAGDPPAGRRVAILLDTSASMRRDDLWTQAIQQVERTIDALSSSDEAALFAFDRALRPLLTFDEWTSADPSTRAASMRARLVDVKPSWNGTHLGDALATVAEDLVQLPGSKGPSQASPGHGQIVLISDLQQGSRAAALQGREWPSGVRLDVRAVATPKSTNAAIQLVQNRADAPAGGSPDGSTRVRLANQPGAAADQFELLWANERGPLWGVAPRTAYVPAGRSQVVRLGHPPEGDVADRVLVRGDDFSFDDALFIAPPQVQSARLLFVGDDSPDDPKGLLYYLRNAVADVPGYQVEVIAKAGDALGESDFVGVRAVVVATALSDDLAAVVRAFAERGGEALWVLKDADAAGGLGVALGAKGITVTESAPRDYALLSRVELADPLFVAFDNPRFADFTKVRFWKHRTLALPGADSARTIAAFDDDAPFLIDRPIGKGRIIVATSGWQPADSQLALSSKFVPLMSGLLRSRVGPPLESQRTVGEPITLAGDVEGPALLHRPDGGSPIDLRNPAAAASAIDRPGVYRLEAAGRSVPIAANVDAEESRTAPLTPADLEQWGAKLARPDDPPDVAAAKQRELRQAEIESRQKIWRWLIVSALGLIAAETLLAGRLARRSAATTSEPPTAPAAQVTT